MTPDDRRHGTYRGAQQHWRDGEKHCEQCRVAFRAYQRKNNFDKANGRPRLVSTDEPRAHVRRLIEAGMSVERIADLSGVGRHTIQSLLTSPRRRMRADNADALVATSPSPEGSGLVRSIGTRRRIEALGWLGWSMPAIVATATRLDPAAKITYSGLRQVTSDRPEMVRVRTAHAVALAFEELCMTPPRADRQAAQVRNRARRKGWLSPLAWDDIDDPDAEPWMPEQRGRGNPRSFADTVAEFDFLIRQGESEAGAMERLGIKRMSSFVDQRKRLEKAAS